MYTHIDTHCLLPFQSWYLWSLSDKIIIVCHLHSGVFLDVQVKVLLEKKKKSTTLVFLYYGVFAAHPLYVRKVSHCLGCHSVIRLFTDLWNIITLSLSTASIHSPHPVKYKSNILKCSRSTCFIEDTFGAHLCGLVLLSAAFWYMIQFLLED